MWKKCSKTDGVEKMENQEGGFVMRKRAEIRKNLWLQKCIIIMSVICLCIDGDLYGAEMKVKSFTMLMEPMTVPIQRKDNNGEICALVKVIIPSAQASFEGNLIGDSDYKASEYWCYFSPGSKRVKIKYPGYEPLLVDFVNIIGSGLKSKGIYELIIHLPNQNKSNATFSIRGNIDFEKPNEKGLYGKKIPYTYGFKLYKNYNDGKYDGRWTLKNNYYEISGIHIGDRLTLIADDERYEPQTITIEQDKIGNTEFNFNLHKKMIPFNGRLVDSETGEPLVGVEVSTRNQNDGIGWFKTDENGNFTIEGMTIDIPYNLYCRNEPYGYLTYETPTIIPIDYIGNEYIWEIKRNKIRATIELNGIDPSEIKGWCSEGHEVKITQSPYISTYCYAEHPLHTKKPSITLKCKGYKTVVIDFEGYFATPKDIKLKKGNENEIIHYRTVHKSNGKNILEQVK